jgi:hypothetical protein
MRVALVCMQLCGAAHNCIYVEQAFMWSDGGKAIDSRVAAELVLHITDPSSRMVSPVMATNRRFRCQHSSKSSSAFICGMSRTGIQRISSVLQPGFLPLAFRTRPPARISSVYSRSCTPSERRPVSRCKPTYSNVHSHSSLADARRVQVLGTGDPSRSQHTCASRRRYFR